MESNKLPNSKTTEELLKSLEEDQEFTTEVTKPRKIIRYRTDVVTFLTVYNIKQGEDKVPYKMVFELYKLWSKDPVTKTMFTREVKKYLPFTTNNNSFFWLLNKDSFALTDYAYQLILNKSRPSTKSPPWKRHFDSFLSKYNIKPGNCWVEARVLYHLYDEYVYAIKKKKPLGELQFYNFCRIYFVEKRTHHQVTFFGIDDNIQQHLTPERVQNIKNGKKKSKNKARKR